MKKVLVLGATGSIGASTLRVISEKKDLYTPVGFSANKDYKKLLELNAQYPGAMFCLTGLTKDDLPFKPDSNWFFGKTGLEEFIQNSGAEICINGIAGSPGLFASVKVLENGINLALANKETMVMAGDLVKKTAKKNHCSIIPVDSEHSALFFLITSLNKCFSEFNEPIISRIILTASGGPFRTWGKNKIMTAKLSDALKHPTWSMGRKITVDSATMANKGLEVIEAWQLFDISPDKITVTVHPQSLVHSMVELIDNSVYAQLSQPDMAHPIAQALSYPYCVNSGFKPFDFSSFLTISFEPPRSDVFRMLPLAYETIKKGGFYPVVYNGANEIAVESFIQGKITFGEISRIVEECLQKDWNGVPDSYESVEDCNIQCKEISRRIISKTEV